MENYNGKERRKQDRFTDETLEIIAERVIEKLEIIMARRSLKAFLWFIGLAVTVFLYWLSTKISVKVD